jgi:hypothetical protein
MVAECHQTAVGLTLELGQQTKDFAGVGNPTQGQRVQSSGEGERLAAITLAWRVEL